MSNMKIIRIIDAENQLQEAEMKANLATLAADLQTRIDQLDAILVRVNERLTVIEEGVTPITSA